MAIRTAVLGYGRSGSTMHAGPIEGLADFEMAAVCDIDPERQAQARERFGCPVYADHHEMLAAESLDLVCVITRSAQHCEMTCDCLRAGANVLVTKPWCVNEAEARRMIAAAEETGKKLLPWLPSRWGTDIARLKALVAEGAIGKPFFVRRAVFGFATRDDWQTETEHGGGILLNWGAHIVDTAMLLAGGEPESVYGRLKRVLNPGDAEDVFHALINMSNGVTVQAEWSFAPAPLPSWFVQGDRGVIVVRDRGFVVYSGDPTRPEDPTDAAAMTGRRVALTAETVGEHVYGDEYAIYTEIARALRDETPYPVTPSDALRLTRVFDAIKDADRRNQVVQLG